MNIGPNPYNNYYDDGRPYHREWELDKLDRERERKFCPFDNVLLVFNAQSEYWMCSKCGWSPTLQKEVDNIEEKDNLRKSVIETSTHFHTNPSGKRPEIPVSATEDYQNSIMKIQSISNSRVISYEEKKWIRGIDTTRTKDADLQRLRDKGYTIVDVHEQSDSKGTLSRQDLERERQRRLRR